MAAVTGHSVALTVGGSGQAPANDAAVAARRQNIDLLAFVFYLLTYLLLWPLALCLQHYPSSSGRVILLQLLCCIYVTHCRRQLRSE